MSDNKKNEVDLLVVYKSIIKRFNIWNALFFKALDFILKKWIVLLLLIIGGVVLGYFTSIDKKSAKKAKVLLRVNFDSVNYVYSAIELLNQKITEKDIIFLKEHGVFNTESEVLELEITPLVNIKDIVDEYDVTNRNLETIIKNVDFNEEDVEVYQTFTSEYNNHIISFILSPNANNQTVSNVIGYINNNKLLIKLKDTILKNMEERIVYNNNMIIQINNTLDVYRSNMSLASPSNQIYVVDKSFSIDKLLGYKIDLKLEIENLKKEILLSQDIAVVLNKPTITNLNTGILGNRIIVYPILFVFTFLFLAYLFRLFKKLRNLANTLNKE